jgi:hypothetical protein
MRTRGLILLTLILVSWLVRAQDMKEKTFVVGMVKANDPDSGQVLTFRIISGDPDHLFSIDPNNGIITASQVVFDSFPNSRTWNLEVMVMDNDRNSPLSTKARITVIFNKTFGSNTVMLKALK